jgi:hypothetical protein
LSDQFKPKSLNFEQRVVDSFNRQTAMKTVGASIMQVTMMAVYDRDHIQD